MHTIDSVSTRQQEDSLEDRREILNMFNVPDFYPIRQNLLVALGENLYCALAFTLLYNKQLQVSVI